MHISIDQTIAKDELVITHGGETLRWGMFKPPQCWWRGVDEDDADSGREDESCSRSDRVDQLLIDLNGYWTSHDEEWQKKAFESYKAILALIDKSRDGGSLANSLVPLVADLMDNYHDMDEIAEYLEKQDLVYPPSVPEVFDSAQGRHHRVLTYTKSEYFGLACLTVGIRALLPVWTGYRAALPKDMERSRVYIELEILRTLRESQVCEHHYMQRLMDYVDGVYNSIDKSAELSSVVAGIGSSEIPNYLFASAICNKLTTTMLNATPGSNTSLVTAMYTKVKQDAQHLADKLGTKVMVRRENRMGGDDGEDKIGYFESYSARQRVSNDIIIGNQVYMYDIRRLRSDLDPSIDKKLVAMCRDSLNSVSKNFIILGGDSRMPIHQTLVQWVLSSTIMMRSVPNINRKAMLNAMAVTQAALITWGFPDIAILLSTRIRSDEDWSPEEVIPLSSKAKAQLDALYKFTRPMDTSNSRSKNARPVSGGYASVETYTDILVSHPLEVVGSDKLLTELKYKSGMPVVVPTIRYQLAELLIAINSRKENRK